MPTAFDDALAALDASHSARIRGALDSWVGHPDWERVRQNIAGETALTVPDFVALLTAFAVELLAGTAPEDAWQATCRSHQYLGPRLPASICPAVLGRAKSLQDHAENVAAASGGDLTQKEAFDLLGNQSGAAVRSEVTPYVYDANLGKGYLIWATFNHLHSGVDPFASLPFSRADVRTALGLQHLVAGDEPLILLHWNHVGSGSPPLHRPTVADAGSYSAYCPCASAAELWGWTQPLSPNPLGFPPQPEVVLPDVPSHGLQLPFRVV